MIADDLLADLIPGLLVELLAGGAGLVVALVSGILLVSRWRVPSVITAMGVGIPAVAPPLFGLYWLSSHEPETAAMAVAATTFLGVLVVLPIALIQGVLLAWAGARRAPRRFVDAGGLAAAACGAAVLTAMGGAVVGNDMFGNIRAVAYMVVALPLVAAALAGGGEDEVGGELAAGASLILALVVATGEAAERGMVQLIMLQRMPEVPVEVRAEMVAAFSQNFVPELWWGAAAVGVVGVAAAGVGVWAGIRGGARPVAAYVGLLWLPVLFFVLLGLGPSETQLVMAANGSP